MPSAEGETNRGILNVHWIAPTLYDLFSVDLWCHRVTPGPGTRPGPFGD